MKLGGKKLLDKFGLIMAYT